MKTGDAIASVAQPIAKGIDYFLNTDLQNCPGCNRMKANLNSGMNLSDAIIDRFWPRRDKTMPIYVITKQIVVEAATPEEAVSKINEGKTAGFNVQERVQPQNVGQGPVRPPGFPHLPNPPQNPLR